MTETDKVFLIDSNILVYAFDSSDVHKQSIAKRLLYSQIDSDIPFVLSTQNLGEFFHIVTTKIKQPVDKQTAKSTINELMELNHCKILRINPWTILSGCEINSRYDTGFWDALIAATMIENKIFNIYTENIKDFNIAGINAVNPFDNIKYSEGGIMNLIIFGPPGIGKGTTSQLLTKKLNVPHIATGDLLREEAKRPKNKVSSYMEKGLLVPDETVSEIVAKRLKQKDCKKGFILDGFPRTTTQAEFLEANNVKIDKVINLDAEVDLIVQRLIGRLICPKCNKIYHKINLPPKKGGICDICNTKLIQRKDDTPKVIKKRIGVYKKDTRPLLDYYREKGIVEDIDGGRDLEDVLKDIFASL